MEIKAACKFDLDSIRALTHLSLFKKADPKTRFTTWSIILAVLSLVILWEMWYFSVWDYVGALCLAVLLFLLESYLYFLLPKIRYKALANLKEAENEYIFSEDKMKVISKAKEFNGQSEMEYSLLVKVYETSRYFFFFQTKNQVFLVDKTTIEGGTAKDIRNKLTASVKKYIVCRY